MATNITRCPHCQTTFRVRDEHLAIANGMVRCGSCLQVFKAKDYFVSEDTEIIEEQTAQPEADDLIDDEILISDDMDELDAEFITDDPSVDFGLRTPDTIPRPRPADSSISSFDFEFDEAVLELDSAGEFAFSNFESELESGDSSDESWAEALLSDDDFETLNEQLPDHQGIGVKSTQQNPVQTQSQAPESEIDFYDQKDDFSDIFGDSTLAAANPADLILDSNKKGKGSSFGSRAHHLHDDPLEFQSKNKKNLPWVWLLGCLLLALVAVSQFFYFNFDTNSRHPQWRPVYSQICAVVGCELPTIQNVNLMAPQLFTVKPHPRLKGAFLAEVLLLNKADYEQPFPDLLLMFKDLNENIVASRRFKPEQYLSGEMAGQNMMPIKTPIHTALEIVDPGKEAVGYSINLLSNH